MNPQVPTPTFDEEVYEILENLYNTAWIEGSNYKENNPEGSPIPSEREKKKTNVAKASIKQLVKEMIIGEDEIPATKEFGLDPKEVFMPSDYIRESKNILRAEQRAIIDNNKEENGYKPFPTNADLPKTKLADGTEVKLKAGKFRKGSKWDVIKGGK